MVMDNVKILGAGPAGLSAAINLADEGYSVDVIEKSPDVGYRFKGDLQGLENWSCNEDILKEFKKMNIKSNFYFNAFKELTITNTKEKWNFYCKRPAFYLVKRGPQPKSLDNGLKEQALDKGVNILFGKNLSSQDVDIIATGPDQSNKFAVARGLIFKTEYENLAIGLVNNYHAFKGYSYLLISDGCGCIVTVLFEGFNDLNTYFHRTMDELLNKFKINIHEPRKFTGFGSFSKKIVNNNNKIRVGESAGFQDFLWGFGIRCAVKSGYIAAKTIIEGEYPEDYYKKVEEYFKPRLNAGVVNRFLWEKFSDWNYSIIVKRIHKSKDPLKYLNSFHNFNLFQKLIYPFALISLRRRYHNLKL
jgi:flavin-dependent dehydrogenase